MTRSANSFLFVTDLDNTLVGDDAALLRLNHLLQKQREETDTKIVYSTGRSPALYRQLKSEKPMLEPDCLILSVGTEVYLHGSDVPEPKWQEIVSRNWDRDLVVATAAHFADLTPQPETEQRPFKASYFLTQTAAPEVISQLDTLLEERGVEVQLIYSGGVDLDVLPLRANKGRAMSFLRDYLGISAEQTVACGDSGNDRSMFENREELGIIVGNAMPELLEWHHANPNSNRYLAQAHYAGGILEGLSYFGLL